MARPKKVVAAAVMTASGALGGGTPRHEALQSHLMTALRNAQDRGVTDQEELARVIREARDGFA